METVSKGQLLWQPSEKEIEKAGVTKFLQWIRNEKKLEINDVHHLWKWSVDELELFWGYVWEYCQIISYTPYSHVLQSRKMPGARWFEGSSLNYAEHVFRNDKGDETALIFQSEIVDIKEISWKELREKTASLADYLKETGVKKGDRIVCYMPNIPETIIAFLACASIGAVWSCCSPDFGMESVVERFKQIEPTVLIAVDGYVYNGKTSDRVEQVAHLQKALPTLKRTVLFKSIDSDHKRLNQQQTIDWQEVMKRKSELVFEPVPFNHPLWILFSSGTTGLPKPIVQSQGGIVVEHLKVLVIEEGVTDEDVFFWFTTTGWMMWNLLVGGLLTGGKIVLYDGSPMYPKPDVLWELAEKTKVSFFGTSAAFIQASLKLGMKPSEKYAFPHLKAICSTGSPLSIDGFKWVYNEVKQDVWLASVSGGTDVCTAFIGGSPVLPVRAGEIQTKALGVNAQAFNDDGKPVLNEVGELVILNPMPSMPIYFWNDAGDKRYKESYFSTFPGIWRHGDWIQFDEKGRSIIFGRSDSTINKQGVRLGTSEIYRAVENIEIVSDSLVVDLESLGKDSYMALFVVLKREQLLDDVLISHIKNVIREQVSPRFVPNEIIAVQQVPRTLTGKKMEVPIKRILLGHQPEKVINVGSMANPEILNTYIEFANKRKALNH
ncbi:MULTISPECIES: acetoacetate--CoA ligase [Cytobacillus]|uniref:Acetoacetate--CoA ligase n=1 Tax=Cytobacillus stercorigallinarum TaxID=2762240 RepID=A0ABR8QVQ8_9BACI|nr:acetoacetate--CoA ligase [Cytobacillus stercorigallinarum]MBD7939632.1 acetoacetate--CoA ligase [Cytobacillus stercorigallinarum]